MTNQTEKSYTELFTVLSSDLQKLNENIFLRKNDNVWSSVMCDFEKSLRSALKENFPNTNIYGCYFHYAKAIWAKLKKCGFLQKLI